MKKLLFILLAASTLLFSSCMEESTYTVTYNDTLSEYANLTVFEYDFNHVMVAKHEVKNAQNATYEFLSAYDASYVVIGVEAIVRGRVMEWYSSEYFKLSSDETVNIYVDYLTMPTQDTNPLNSADVVSHYIY